MSWSMRWSSMKQPEDEHRDEEREGGDDDGDDPHDPLSAARRSWRRPWPGRVAVGVRSPGSSDLWGHRGLQRGHPATGPEWWGPRSPCLLVETRTTRSPRGCRGARANDGPRGPPSPAGSVSVKGTPLPRTGPQVCTVWGAEDPLKSAASRGSPCSRREKMPPPSSATTIVRRTGESTRAEQARDEERQVAQQRNRATGRGERDADRGGHGAVDAGGTAVE